MLRTPSNLFAAALAALLVTSAAAEAAAAKPKGGPKPPVKRNYVQIFLGIGGGTIFGPTDGQQPTGSGLFAVGAFLNRDIALNVGLTYRSATDEVEGGLGIGELFVDAAYHWASNQIDPYVFAGGGGALSDRVEPGSKLLTASARVGAGFDYYLESGDWFDFLLLCGPDFPVSLGANATYTMTPGFFAADDSFELMHSGILHIVFKLLISAEGRHR